MLKNKYIKIYVKKYWYLFIIGILATAIVGYIQLYIPGYLGEVVRIVGNNPNAGYQDIENIIFKLLIVAFSLFVGRVLYRYCLFAASGKIEAGFRHDMFLKAERLSQRYYHENKVGNIMSWFSSDLETIEEYAGWGVIMIVDASFLSAMSILKMVSLDYVLTLVAVLPMLSIVIWGSFSEKLMAEKWDERQAQYDKLYDFTQENFSGIRVIKAFVKEVQEVHYFAKVAKKNADKNIEFAKLAVSLDVWIEIIISIISALIMAVGSYFVYSYATGAPVILFGHQIVMDAGDLTAFVGYSDTLIWPLIAMGQILQMRSRTKASLARVSRFLDEPEEIHSVKEAVSLQNANGDIEFRDFSFHYPDTDIHSLNNISFHILSGEMVGIVGKIGSGKTTLVNSLLRLYNIEDNKIFIDGIDLMKLNIASLRDNIAYVPQDNFLFSDNIRNNIAFSNKSMKLDQIRMAAEFADVDENISGFSEGYETVTGERGVTLSGGQKQRIAIARAYAKNAPIMIMDDSVSAVDLKTEENILKNIREKRSGKTTIIIASRVSTVAHLDKVLVLNEGKVEAFDTPENCQKISPTYQKMVFLQRLESEL